MTLKQLADLSYRWGDCQALAYDPVRTEIFPGLYLSNLWHDCRNSGRAKFGILEPLFCGMRDLSHDAICAYLHSRKLTILGEWRRRQDPTGIWHVDFIPLGFCFLSTACQGSTQNSAFGAYAFFEPAWRTPQQLVLTYLGIAYLFQEYKLVSLHGIRYSDNKLTQRWMEKFGFRDIGTIPNYMTRPSGELASATISTLGREDFESRLGRVLDVDQG